MAARSSGIRPVAGADLSGATAVVTGGAGFLGSHLSTRLIELGARVIVIDNLSTGTAANVAHLFGHGRFRFLHYDVTDYLHVDGDVDFVLHWASPASPADYLRLPIQTLKVGALGTHKALGLALAKSARFMLASTSEVYGDPDVHPQPETYWGNVNHVGPRGVYDEAKRFAEALVYAYRNSHGLAVRVPRIFNTFGPRLRLDDGRAVPTFIAQALHSQPLTIHGDGLQTRSLCYVDDMVSGLVSLLVSDYDGPVNLGNPDEVTILELAEAVQDAVGIHPGVVHIGAMVDDPKVRQPDVSIAARELRWKAEVSLAEGLARTVTWVRSC